MLRLRLADADLLLDCDDEEFLERIRSIFGECLTEDRGPVELRCTIRSRDTGAQVRFEDPEPLEMTSFAAALFGDRGFREGAPPDPSRRVLLDANGSPALIATGDDEAVAVTPVWRALLGNLAVSRALRLQPHLLFLHAGSVSIGGRGVLLSGPKGAGKSTLSLALASRGHAFLGDEIAALRSRSRELVPFRRAASIRSDGVRGARVSDRIAQGNYPMETLPDGSQRTRARVGELFPDSPTPGPVALRALFFLSGFEDAPSLTRLEPDRSLAGRLQPLPVCFWGVHRGRRMLELLTLVDAVPCFALKPGEPDETAALVEAAVERL